MTAPRVIGDLFGAETRAERPLFIPLRREFFDAFERGAKTVEIRRDGPRWNARTCRVDRAVVLSLGYGGRRLSARIAAIAFRPAAGAEEIALFGDGAPCIIIVLRDIAPLDARHAVDTCLIPPTVPSTPERE